MWITQILWWGFWLGWGLGESVLVFPCTPLVYSLGPLCSSFIYINIAFYRSKKKKLRKQMFSTGNVEMGITKFQS